MVASSDDDEVDVVDLGNAESDYDEDEEMEDVSNESGTEIEVVAPNETTTGRKRTHVSSNTHTVVLSPKEVYRRRRRKIRRMLRPGVVPSFLSLIVGNGLVDEDDEMLTDNKVFRVDVDECLGLKKVLPDEAASFVPAKSTLTPPESSLVSPADEGWYEGVVSPMAMAEDADYLSEMHLLVRRNLEFFSATAMDTAISQAGRRTPTVLGKVGLRCIHCNNSAKLFLERKQKGTDTGDDDKNSDGEPTILAHQLWPPGSISYPVNIAGLYAVCAQKPQLHFEKCPNLPPDVKAEFLQLMRDEPGGTPRKRQRQSVGGNGSGISAIMYYAIAARRIGLVDVQAGIRFGRDLNLEPLSIEAVRNQVDGTKTSKRFSGSHVSVSGTTPVAVSSGVSSPDAVASGVPVERIAADPESESILAEAVAEKDDPTKYLARSEDKSLVSDFIFLIIRQMAICRALPSDFSSRGKKTKLMRVGFAGFCCRHCMADAEGSLPSTAGDFCCRSFSSAADNLASAISNSFVLHLQKCYRVPAALKKALSAYKRLHGRQMAQLAYGSQRRLFHALWTRLREADVPEEEMMEQLKALGTPFLPPAATDVVDDSATPSATTDGAVASTQSQPPPVDEVDQALADENNPPSGGDKPAVEISNRPSTFPISDDPETQATLKAAEDFWDPKENDNLILHSERNLVSDYVFLTMRQLKMVRPNALDKSRIRRVSHGGPLPGMCCKFCLNAPTGHLMTPSGRSFPSAPDNMASALNTSLYNHMQNCYLVPDHLKRAFVHLKKIHSVQCSSLKFGSQRRYFNLVFDRLRKVADGDGAESSEITPPKSLSQANTETKGVDKKALTEHRFEEGPFGSLVCQRCRMVPFEFRAAGSIFLLRPTTSAPLRDHSHACQDDRFDLNFCVKTLQAIREESGLSLDQLSHPLFESVVRHAMGGNEALTQVFARRVVQMLDAGDDDDDDNSNRSGSVDLDTTSGLWSEFPPNVDVEAVTSAVGEYAREMGLNDDDCIFRYLRLISPTIHNSLHGEA